jgi:hypothetical protein
MPLGKIIALGLILAVAGCRSGFDQRTGEMARAEPSQTAPESDRGLSDPANESRMARGVVEPEEPREDPRVALLRALTGASLVSDEEPPHFLGNLSNRFDSESIFNRFGTYGSRFSSDSIWNKYGSYGGKYSSYSPFNKYTSTPPLIVKDGSVIGRLTVNRYVRGALDPYAVVTLFGGDVRELLGE